MNKITKACPICGTEYSHCKHCENIGSWRALVCSPMCYHVYMGLYEIREGIKTEEETRDSYVHVGITEEYANAHLIPSVANRVIEILNIGKADEDISIENVIENVAEKVSDNRPKQNFKKKKAEIR